MKQNLTKWLYGCIILLSSMATKTSNAQTYCAGSTCELVCNGGFETISATPTGISQLTLATGWTIYAYTPDLFSALSTGISGVDVPCNIVGHQAAHTGNNYVGIAQAFHNANDPYGWTEGISSSLNDYLAAGKIYEISFWVSKSDFSTENFDNLRVDLTNGGAPIKTFSISSTYTGDYTNWVLVTLPYCNQDEGVIDGINIYSDALSKTGCSSTSVPCTPSTGNINAYIYIDDVSVKEAQFMIASDTVCRNTTFTLTAATQSTACAVNMANYTYSWDHGDGSTAVNTGTNSTTTYSYSGYGTFTGTLSISTGSCANTYTYNVFVPNTTISIITNTNTICNGTTGFTATPNPAGTYTCAWGMHDAATGTVVPTGSYTVTSGTTYTPTINFLDINQNVWVYVSMTNTMGCTFVDSIYMPSCCPTATNVVKHSNKTFTVSTTISTASVSFGGTITVNSGVTLTLLITNAQLDPNTKFVLNGTAKLVVDKSYLHACNAMWDGIYPLGTSTVNIINSIVEDAQRVVIDTLGTAVITFTNNYINKNNIGIAFKATRTSTATVNVKNNLFTCSNVSIPAGANKTPAVIANLTNASTLGAFTSTVMLPPYNTAKSYCGIYLYGATLTSGTITIGASTNGTENVFDKMQMGIFSYASQSLVQNNVFQNTKSTIAPTGNVNAGIALLGPIYGGGSSYMKIGGALAQKNTFRDNDYGIYNWYQSGLLATYNTFSVQTNGIYVTDNNNGSAVNLQYNNFYKNGIGVNFYNNTEIAAGVKDNNFDNSASAIGTYADNFAIRCTEATQATGIPYPAFDIDNNNITGYYNGIYAVNTLSLIVDDNEVHMRQDNTTNHWQSGISITTTQASDINNNIVDMSSLQSSNYWQAGIKANENGIPKIHCNSINNLAESIQIELDNTTASNDGVRSNYMQNTATGIWLVNAGELGNQAGSTGSNSSDNVWATSCNVDVYSQYSSNPNTDIFFTRIGGGYDLPVGKVGKDGSSNCHEMFGNNSSAAGSATTCIANASTPSNTKMAGDGALVLLVQRGEEIALDYNQAVNFQASAAANLNAIDDMENNEASIKAMKRRNLLNNILLQQIDIQSSPELVAFMNRVKTENTGLLFAVDSLIHYAEKDSAQIATAQNANAIIFPTNKVEQSQQGFNTLYLSYLAQKNKLGASEITSLETIAVQCPVFYGPAVYQARVVLFDLNKQQYRSECENVSPDASSSEKRMAAKQQDVMGLNLFPNPANTVVYVNTGNYDSVVLKIYSIMGNLVIDKIVTDNEKTDIDQLSNGIYIYKLYQNDTELKVGKLIITH